MNGRVYDYNLGRFLSVAPYTQSPGNTQSVNPYSYVMNNPLAGTDPIGYAANPDVDQNSICGNGDTCGSAPNYGDGVSSRAGSTKDNGADKTSSKSTSPKSDSSTTDINNQNGVAKNKDGGSGDNTVSFEGTVTLV